MARTLLYVLLFLCVQLTPSAASDATWKRAISNAELRSREYSKKAASLGVTHIGTMWNELDADVHKCAVLARMLGHRSIADRLDVKHVSIEVNDGQELAMASNSLSNWAVVAWHALSLNKDQRAEVWNLDCVGKFGISRSLFVSRPEGVRSFFTVERDILRILGDVEPGFFDKLKSAIETNPQVKVVALGSGGGLVNEAIKSARFIRARGLDTVLWNNCLSACTLVFLGGISRTIWSPYPELGFHRVSREGIAARDNDAVYDIISRFSSDMGANGRFIVELMKMAEPSGMHFIPRKNTELLCQNRVATWIQRLC
jgi:hypothetical protein